MRAVQVQHYLGRARDLLRAMNLLRDDLAVFGYSSALSAIHGAISYSDALRIGLGGIALTSEDHQTAARELQQRLDSRNYEKSDGVLRLTRLIADKNFVAYGSERVSETKFKSILQQAERFAAWAEKAGRELRIEGWRDE